MKNSVLSFTLNRAYHADKQRFVGTLRAKNANAFFGLKGTKPDEASGPDVDIASAVAHGAKPAYTDAMAGKPELRNLGSGHVPERHRRD